METQCLTAFLNMANIKKPGQVCTPGYLMAFNFAISA
jgi:hypothetical protein